MSSIHIYLNFDGKTEDAFNFYKGIFGGDLMDPGFIRYETFMGEGVKEADKKKIAHVSYSLPGGTMLMGTDYLEGFGKPFAQGNNMYIVVEADSAGHAQQLFDALSKGGTVEMPLGKTEWAEKYGSLVDPYGIPWMISFTGNVQFSPGG